MRKVRGGTLGPKAAAGLVFASSAAVLVVELVALRLLAPHLGLTLETNTLVIGTALAAIAAGSWAGGQQADRTDPRRMLAPLLALSGITVAATPFAVRWAAAVADGALLYIASVATIVVPGALLSAVTPMATKLRLTALHETGTVVGRLSGIGTLGAIVGTLVTGFILISRVPITWIMVGTGVLLVTGAFVTHWHLGGRGLTGPMAAGCAVLLPTAGLGSALAPQDCDVETTYHCAAVLPDPQREGGRTLVLDGLWHSYVDVDDPAHIEFDYLKSLIAALDSRFAPGSPLRAHHIGGGGLTLPRYLAHDRTGTRSTVSEVNAGVLTLDEERLGLQPNENLTVRVEDARTGLRTVASGSVDLVVGDAFGGVSVPWHLTTQEFVEQIRTVMAPGAVYALNVIDNPPLRFARAEAATLRSVFPHVAVAASPGTVAGTDGGNHVLLVAAQPLDTVGWQQRMRDRGLDWQVIRDDALTRWIGQSPTLRDDFAPVDQLLTPY